MTSYRFFKMAVIESEIYFRVQVSDCIRIKRHCCSLYFVHSAILLMTFSVVSGYLDAVAPSAEYKLNVDARCTVAAVVMMT